MRPWNTWLYGLGLSGVLALGAAGCGGGDVPDPSADEAAATDEGAEAPGEPSPPGPAPEAPAVTEAAAPAATGEATSAAPALPGDSAPAAAPAPAETPTAAAPVAPQPAEGQAAAKSDTAEMLALATGAAAAPSAPAAAAPGAAAPGGPGPEPGAGDLANQPGLPGAPGAPGPERDIGSSPGLPGAPSSEGDSGAMAGDVDGSGAGGGTLQPGDTHSPRGAVNAFLYALKHKDRDRLAEATALRANSDEGGKYKELFSRIIDSSISDSELDDLSTKLEGFTYAGENQVKSTGRQGVTIRKAQKDGGWLQRTITVRKEKKGWGVLDISGQTEFDNIRVRGMRRR